MTRDRPDDHLRTEQKTPSPSRDPVTRMTPIGSERRVTEGSPIDRSVCGSARPPKAGRSPAAPDASAEERITTASERARGVPRKSVPLADRLALRPKEAAEALGLSERKLREVLPQLPHIRLGGAVLLPVEGLQAWLREQAKVEQGRVEAVVDEILSSIEKDRT